MHAPLPATCISKYIALQCCCESACHNTPPICSGLVTFTVRMERIYGGGSSTILSPSNTGGQINSINVNIMLYEYAWRFNLTSSKLAIIILFMHAK